MFWPGLKDDPKSTVMTNSCNYHNFAEKANSHIIHFLFSSCFEAA